MATPTPIAATTPTRSTTSTGARALQARVLLVEADEVDAERVADLFAGSDLAVDLIRARSADEGSALLLRDSSLTCALVDLDLPDSSGLETLDRLGIEQTRVPIVVLTRSTDEIEGVAAVSAGATDFLLEDQVDSFSLARAVRFAMERRRAEESQRRLHEAQLRRAEYERLERGLVPRPVLRDDCLRCDIVYRAGGDLAMLGGDFIDLVERSDGSVRAVVGDVAGHGANEAAVGVSLRQVWRSLVLAEIEDAKILPLLERVLELEHEEALFVTVADVTVSPDRGAVCYRLAGHWPPLLHDDDAGWRSLENDHRGMPLGVTGGVRSTWDDHDAPLRPGSTILLFTDGLVDAQSPAGRLELAGLLDLLDSMPPGWSLRDLVALVEEGHGGPIDDDVAIVRLAWTT